MRIKKFQGGGLVYRPLPIIPEQPQVAPAGGEQKLQETGIDDKLMKELLGKGITNDVIAYTKQVNNAYAEYSKLDPILRNSSYGRNLRSIMKGDIGTLNMLVRNQDQLKEAATRATNNKAMDELAITSFGVVVQDLKDGTLKEVSHDELANLLNSKDNRYRPITNAELISQREYNKNLVGDVVSINSLNSSIGMPLVKEEIWKILQYVESNKEQNKEAATIAKGLKDAKDNADKGVFDVEKMASIESNKVQLEQAIESTWTNLSENSKSLLKARAVINGATGENIDKVARQYMVSLLSPKQSTKLERESTEKFDPSATKFAFGEGKDAQDEMKYYESFADINGTIGNIIVNDGSGYQYKTKASYMAPFKKSDGSDYGIKAVSKMPELSSVLDLDNVYIGNQKIDRLALNSLVYGGGKIAQVELPYTEDRGRKKVDIEMASKLGSAKDELKNYGGDKAPTTVKEKIYSKHGVPTNGRGIPAIQQGMFATFTGYVNKGVTDDPDDDKSLLEISSGKLGEQNLAQYESAYFEGASKEEQKALKKQYKDTVYQGSVYIPISGSRAMGRMTDKSGYTIPKSKTTLDYMQATSTGVEKESVYSPGAYSLNIFSQ